MLLVLVLIGMRSPVWSQGERKVQVNYKDSVQTEEFSSFVHNNIQIKGPAGTYLFVKVNLPTGWKLVSKDTFSVYLKDTISQISPLTLLKLPNATSQWSAVFVSIRNKNTDHIEEHKFYVKAFPINRFKAVTTDRVKLITENIRSVTLRAKLQNIGNAPQSYTQSWRSRVWGVTNKKVFTLRAGQDTTLEFTGKLSKSNVKFLKKENIYFDVSDGTSSSSVSYELSKVSSRLKEHKTAYNMFPLDFSSGLISTPSNFNYFYGFDGQLNLKGGKVAFSYRSKQLGMRNTIQRNSFVLNYTNAKWQVYAGDMSETKNFVAFGQGLKVNHVTKRNSELGFQFIKHFKNYLFTNDYGELTYQHSLKRIRLKQGLAFNLDKVQSTNSYLLFNEAQVIRKEKISLAVNGNVGYEKAPSNNLAKKKEQLGTSVGYSFAIGHKGLNFVSLLQTTSLSYPGFGKGGFNQSHSVKYNVGKVFFDFFYMGNKSTSTILRDTLFNTDVFSYNMSRYGLNTGFMSTKTHVNLSAGVMNQPEMDVSGATKYKFFEFGYSTSAIKNVSLFYSSMNGINYMNGVSTWLSSNSLNLTYKRFGLRGVYVQSPLPTRDTFSKGPRYSKTLNISPSARIRVSKTFQTSLHYNVSKSLLDESITTNMGGSINYRGISNGLNLSLGGVVPISNANSALYRATGSYISLSIQKKFNVPLLHKKKYSTLAVHVFKDENGNNLLDVGEEYLKEVLVTINNMTFLTDSKGSLLYKHLDRKEYEVEVGKVKDLKGYIPAKGYIQMIHLNKDAELLVPFKKSKVIVGKVDIRLDSLFNMSMTSENIKVTAKDSSGNTFTTFSNSKGEFFINVPAEVYSVSLNPEAFNESIQPVVYTLTADLSVAESAHVNFEIRQKGRKVRLLKSN